MTKLTLHDGRTLDTVTKEVDGEEDDVFSPAPQTDIRLEDLPADPRTMNVVCSVLSYVIMGIKQRDICLALGCSEEQLTEIMESEAYMKSHTMVIQSFVRGQQNAARDIISANAVHAARELTRVMKSKSESNRLRASEGILNRAGINDANGHDAMAEGLIIRVVKDTKTDIHIKVG